jgi:hypothetical protein
MLDVLDGLDLDAWFSTNWFLDKMKTTAGTWYV